MGGGAIRLKFIFLYVNIVSFGKKSGGPYPFMLRASRKIIPIKIGQSIFHPPLNKVVIWSDSRIGSSLRQNMHKRSLDLVYYPYKGTCICNISSTVLSFVLKDV